MRRIFLILGVVTSLIFLHSCIFITPTATLEIVDEGGNTYLIDGTINGKSLKIVNGKVMAEIPDGVYKVILDVNVFEPTYNVEIKNGHGKIVLKRSSKPSVDLLVKNSEKVLIIANMQDYKGVGVYFSSSTVRSSSNGSYVSDFGEYLVVKNTRRFAIAGKRGRHLEPWMELKPLDIWDDIIDVKAVNDSYEKIDVQ